MSAVLPMEAGAVLSHDILWLLVFANANKLGMAQEAVTIHSTKETSTTSFGFTHRSFTMSCAVMPSPQ